MESLYEPYEILQLFNADMATDSNDDSTTAQTAPDTPPTLHMVSDGSELARKMTFGWILSTSQGKQLAICSDQLMARAALTELKEPECYPPPDFISFGTIL
jgi:hypothetical protein